MKLTEFFDDDDISTGFYDPADDNVTKRKVTDTRKERLTLRHVNKLKKLRALRRLEKLKREDLLAVMYGSGGGDDGGGGFF